MRNRTDCVEQMSLLLNLERPQDATDYWEPGSPLQAQLTADEARKSLWAMIMPKETLMILMCWSLVQDAKALGALQSE